MGWRGAAQPAGTAEVYRTFARQEARGRSPAYEALAEAVAGDAGVLRFLGRRCRRTSASPTCCSPRPGTCSAPPPTWPRCAPWSAGTRPALAGVMLARRTQTNEPARCALLLPALAQLPPPLALIEVGASAGLTLLVDRYSYDYAGHRIAGLDPRAPVLRCAPRGPVPLPDRGPGGRLAGRAGPQPAGRRPRRRRPLAVLPGLAGRG